MNAIVVLLQLVIIFGSTITILLVDRKMRLARGEQSLHEPELSTLILLAFLCNIVCLPYYFMKTRGWAGVLWGVLWLVGYVGLSIGVSLVASLVMG